jgi:5-methylcytosine-specific restriction endonuclease McrA
MAKKKNISLDDIIELHNKGLYDKEIAEILGCSRENIVKRLNKAGIKNRRSKIDDIDLRNRISNALKGRYIGEKNPNYKGYTDERTLARGLFKTISKEMIRNCDYTCQICGQHGGTMNTHHIKPFSVIFDEFVNNAYSGNIENFYHEILSYEDFTNKNNLIVVCEKCHKAIHYTDNPDLSPYRWDRATTIESIGQEPILPEEASRVEPSGSKCEDT